MDSTEGIANRSAAPSGVRHLAPARQPTTVREIAERLFPAYTIDGGSVHLAGCILEDRLFVRIATQHRGESVEFYLDGDGKAADPATVEVLGMDNTVELPQPPEPSDLAQAAIDPLVAEGRRMLAQQFPPGNAPERVDTAAVWCKHVEGKLRFTTSVGGGGSADLLFSGWARTLVPPPFVCPHSDAKTFHLATTDDGRIVAAEEIVACAETGRRVLADDLVVCHATGRRVLAELTAVCPVTAKPVLRTTLVACDMCGQRVAPTALRGKRCLACGNLRPLGKSDPRLARLLAEYPLMDRWRKWRIGETTDVYILTAIGWFRKLLVVADKDSLAIKRLGSAGRLFSRWEIAEPDQYDAIIRG